MSVYRKLAALTALLLTVAIGFASMLPEERRSLIDTRGPLHPYVHVVTFTVVAWLAAWSTRSPLLRVVLCAGLALFGCATEIVEWKMYGNPLEWADIILDAIGTVAGTGLGALTLPRDSLRRRSESGQRWR